MTILSVWVVEILEKHLAVYAIVTGTFTAP